MKYISTRGEAPSLGFADAMLAGLARDGGLYVPEAWPQHSKAEIRAIAGRPYAETALSVLKPFVDDEIDEATLARLVTDAYAGFRHPAVAPLVQTGANAFILELFHGPTLAFKDVAMQLLGRLMDHVLSRARQARDHRRGDFGRYRQRRDRGVCRARQCRGVHPLSARAGVGSAAPADDDADRRQRPCAGGGRNLRRLPGAGEGAVQRRQIPRRGLALSGVNSINWARIMAQIVYYFTAATTLGAPDRAVSFCVPTGNFGDIFAGYAAKRMGLPVDRLIIATNANDILARTLKSGRYETGKVFATSSPSMDIQVSSNFERLLFEASGRDAAQVRSLMAGLGQSGAFTVPGDALAEIRRDFDAGSASEAETAATIRDTLEKSGYLADPHTAVGLSVAGALRDCFADGDARNRASGQVPRRGRGGVRRSPRPARLSRRPDQEAGAVRDRAQRHGSDPAPYRREIRPLTAIGDRPGPPGVAAAKSR